MSNHRVLATNIVVQALLNSGLFARVVFDSAIKNPNP